MAGKTKGESAELKAIKGLGTRLASIDNRLERIEGRLDDIEAYVPSEGKLPRALAARKKGPVRSRR